MNPLANLKHLRDDMVEKEENFDIFDFSYRDKNYFVIVEVFNQENKPQYATAKLIFLRTEDVTDKFESWANSNRLMTDQPYAIKNYFGIPNFDGRIRSALEEFYGLLGKSIPPQFMNGRNNEIKKKALTDYIVSSDPKDPNKKFCFAAMGTGGRSPFNDEKTKLLRPALYSALGKYNEVSFSYSADRDNEKNDEDIIRNFEHNRRS